MDALPSPRGDVTRLLERMRSGDSDAAETLLSQVVKELRNLAAHYLRSERRNHTLQPTALVNEAYLRLIADQARTWQNRAHFIGVSASVMRRILVDYARRRQAAKRGGLDVPDRIGEELYVISPEQSEELIALDTALERLEKMNPRQRQVVEMRYFGGLSIEETAEALGVSPMTVKRDWVTARAWLRAQIRPEMPS